MCFVCSMAKIKEKEERIFFLVRMNEIDWRMERQRKIDREHSFLENACVEISKGVFNCLFFSCVKKNEYLLFLVPTFAQQHKHIHRILDYLKQKHFFYSFFFEFGKSLVFPICWILPSLSFRSSCNNPWF